MRTLRCPLSCLPSLPLLLLPLLLAALLPGCAGDDAGDVAPAGEEWSVVPPGKADDYYSNVSREFEVSGTIQVSLDPARATEEAYRKERIEGRITAVGLFLTAYMTNKLERFFSNMSFGGFSAMVRNYTVAAEDVQELEPGRLEVRFTIDLAGPRQLLEKLPLVEGPEAGSKYFVLVMPEGFTADPDYVPRGEIRNFNPETYGGAKEELLCRIEPEVEANDAYPDYLDLIGDGLVDITLWYGHDYNESRSDLREAEDAWRLLSGSMGFAAPAATFAELNPESGPFTRTMLANGQQVQLAVRIFHSDMFTSDRKKAHDLVLDELRQRDVFFYNGHAGPYYGFYLSDDKPNDVKYQELATTELPAKQQIVVAQGCQTYSQYADVFYANPAKSAANLDVFTTVNFSYGEGTLGLLQNLLRLDRQGVHQPQTYGRMVRDLNAEWWNSYKEVFYGVHGIDGNPRLHPYAALERIGQPCEIVQDCGDAGGNVCIRRGEEQGKICGAVALDQAQCPAGSSLFPLAQGSTIRSHACLP
ncbi:MAG: hypothetical protein FJ125_00850 [Deltaproteobacteria bacterium]|nr:hypothetical protein [Deltaproteobacteria bacterium]